MGAQIDDFLKSGTAITGVTSLAIGADQLFAERVMAGGGALHVIVPHDRYEDTFKSEQDRSRYESLLAKAGRVEILSTTGSLEEAYLQAGHRVADLSDVVLAVWNGEAAAGKGGTADMVAYAAGSGVPVIHINPITRVVSQHRAG